MILTDDENHSYPELRNSHEASRIFRSFHQSNETDQYHPKSKNRYSIETSTLFLSMD